jgi:hypothetical protein
MRKLLIAIVILGALASIALCASYGWDQATVLKDRVTQAFVYGFVALATLTLHMVALRAWVIGWRKSASFIGAVAMLAFVIGIKRRSINGHLYLLGVKLAHTSAVQEAT